MDLSERCGVTVTRCTPGCYVERDAYTGAVTYDSCFIEDGWRCRLDSASSDMGECEQIGSTPTAYCGNGQCEAGETPSNCSEDCGGGTGEICGNGVCGAGETSANCAQDCGSGEVCGNGHCGPGESSTNCPSDCGPISGDGCGNGVCESGETPYNCAYDCGADLEVSCTISCPSDMYAHVWWAGGQDPNGHDKAKGTLDWSTSAKDICVRGQAYIDFNCANQDFTSWDQSKASVTCTEDFNKILGKVDPRGEGEVWFTSFSCMMD